jgi:hypothetical protein
MRVWSRRGPTAVVAAAVLMASFGGAVRRRPPGPYKGYDMVNGESWIPYQELRVVTPPFPEYVSGHSTFSAAGARVITTFIGSDSFGASVTVRAGDSRIEPRTAEHLGTPAKNVTLSWPTFPAPRQ